MTNTDKTVFISYRRDTSSYLARAIYQNLRSYGYDVFMDVESLNSGTFDTIILNQIAARAHFLVILESGSENRLADQGDWLRREIERAIELKRNIVPILAGNFSFKDTTQYLEGKLMELPRYNGVPLHRDYFEEAMERLRSRFLNKPVFVEIVPVPATEFEIVKKKAKVASQLPASTAEQFTVEFLFNRSNEKYHKNDFAGSIKDLNKAIALDPECVGSYYNNRGISYSAIGQYDKAIKDYDQAIALNPEEADTYNSRGFAYHSLGQYDKAIKDYDQAIALNPEEALAYANRGHSYSALEQYDNALEDYNQAVGLDPTMLNSK